MLTADRQNYNELDFYCILGFSSVQLVIVYMFLFHFEYLISPLMAYIGVEVPANIVVGC